MIFSILYVYDIIKIEKDGLDFQIQHENCYPFLNFRTALFYAKKRSQSVIISSLGLFSLDTNLLVTFHFSRSFVWIVKVYRKILLPFYIAKITIWFCFTCWIVWVRKGLKKVFKFSTHSLPQC